MAVHPPALRPRLKRLRSFVSDQILYPARITYYHLRYPKESIFSVIHRTRAWGQGDSVSGGGSDLPETRTVRTLLPMLLAELGVHSMLDAPCGDFHWMSRVDLSLDRYIGVDIVEEIITANRTQFERPGVSFFQRDIANEDLPRADLILCRDCMVHMSNPEIVRTLQNFRRSGATYLLATTYPGTVRQNRSIPNGMWRYLDLQRPPFNFPEPLRLIAEETQEIYKAKSLGLWRLADLTVADLPRLGT